MSKAKIAKVASFGVLVALLCSPSSEVAAQSATYHFEYKDSISNSTSIAALQDGLFGDTTSFVEGATEFGATDVVARSSGKIPVTFGRNWKPYGTKYYGEKQAHIASQLLGRDWEADVPFIKGIYPNYDSFLTGSRARCSQGIIAPNAVSVPGMPPVVAYNFWDGLRINIPGQGAGDMQLLNQDTIVPTDGSTYKFGTANGWRISCLTELKNGVGEGFLLVTPDGTKYYFDWLATRPITPMPVPFLGHGRTEMTFMATKAVDRHGNEVIYSYDPAIPVRIQSIQATDGARIDLSYDQHGRISQASTGGRVWTYEYEIETTQYARLVSVIQPDQSRWSLEDLVHVGGNLVTGEFGKNCNYSPGVFTSEGNGPVFMTRMKHPSGAVGEFYFKAIAHGYNNLPHGSCTPDGVGMVMGRPKASTVMALIKKAIYGAGVPHTEWNFHYQRSWSYNWECTNGCPDRVTTTVTRNDGRIDKYIYGNDFQHNANQLLSHRVLQDGQVLQRQDYTYLASASGQPFPDVAIGPIGTDGGTTLENPFFRRNRPRVETRTYVDGVVMVNAVTAFDRFVRPTQITRSSSPGVAPPDPPVMPPVDPPNPTCPGCIEP